MSILHVFTEQELSGDGFHVPIEPTCPPPPSGSFSVIACTFSDALVEGILVIAVFAATYFVMSVSHIKCRSPILGTLCRKAKRGLCKAFPCQRMSQSSRAMAPPKAHRTRLGTPSPASWLGLHWGLADLTASIIIPGVQDSIAQRQCIASLARVLAVARVRTPQRSQASMARPAIPT